MDTYKYIEPFVCYIAFVGVVLQILTWWHSCQPRRYNVFRHHIYPSSVQAVFSVDQDNRLGIRQPVHHQRRNITAGQLIPRVTSDKILGDPINFSKNHMNLSVTAWIRRPPQCRHDWIHGKAGHINVHFYCQPKLALIMLPNPANK